MAQDGLGFARIVVAVVVEENDFAADFCLQPAGGQDFGNEKPLREKSAGLLAETDDRGVRLTAGRGLRLRAFHFAGLNTACSDQAEHHASGAADEVVPEIADAERKIEHEHQRLRRQRRPEHRRAAHAAEKKRHQEQPEHHAIKNRADDVDRLNQVLRQVRKQREARARPAPKTT